MNVPIYRDICYDYYNSLGTKLAQRLARGDTGINKLDDACKEHDIAYENHKDKFGRYLADKKLTSAAFKRVIAPDAKLGERATALAVSAIMKAKTSLTKLGSGLRRKLKQNKPRKVGKPISFDILVKNARIAIRKSKPKTIDGAIKTALKSVDESRKGSKVTPKRVIKLPVSGGMLPILPILAGLSALGSVTQSAVGIAKTISEIKNAKKIYEDNRRTGNDTEPIKVGKGLYLAPWVAGKGICRTSGITSGKTSGKTPGYGLYLRPYPKN